MTDIIVCDFDGVLFKQYHGLIQENVDYVLSTGLDVYVVTFRYANEGNVNFIQSMLVTEIPLVGIAFAGSKKKDPLTKAALVNELAKKYSIKQALDNDEAVVLQYNSMGIDARLVTQPVRGRR